MDSQLAALQEADRRFLARRARLVRAWRYWGALLLAALAGMGLWLFLTRPLLANPWQVLAQLRTGGIAGPMLELMAGLLPIALWLCLLLAGVLVLLVYAACANERRYLEIIRRHCR